jgi:predicted nucleic acid-binding protein
MSGTEFLLDTNVVIDFLAGDEAVVTYLRSAIPTGSNLSISQITRIELLAVSDLGKEEEHRIRSFLRQIQVLPLTEDVEERAILIRRHNKLKIPDAIIVATAVTFGCVLVTRDRRLLNADVDDLDVTIPVAER